LTTVTRIWDPSGIVIVLVLEVRDVWVEGSSAPGKPTKFVLEELY
jgi:hypothetical protein